MQFRQIEMRKPAGRLDIEGLFKSCDRRSLVVSQLCDQSEEKMSLQTPGIKLRALLANVLGLVQKLQVDQDACLQHIPLGKRRIFLQEEIDAAERLFIILGHGQRQCLIKKRPVGPFGIRRVVRPSPASCVFAGRDGFLRGRPCG